MEQGGGGLDKGRNYDDKKLFKKENERENSVATLAVTLNMSPSPSPLTNMVVI